MILDMIHAVAIILFVLPLIPVLIKKLNLGPLLAYTVLAGLIFSDWTDAHPILSMGIFVGLALLTVASWFYGIYRSIRA